MNREWRHPRHPLALPRRDRTVSLTLAITPLKTVIRPPTRWRTGLNGVRIVGGGTVTIINCSIRNFSQRGVDFEGSTDARVYLQDSQVAGNAGGGLLLQGASGAVNKAVIERTMFDLNGGPAVQAVGPGQVVLSGNTLAFSAVSLSISGGANVVSYGNNIFRGSGTPTSTISLQ